MGRRLEDGRLGGQNLVQPGFGSRQPCPECQAQSKSDVNHNQLQGRMVAERLAKHTLHHDLGTPLEKLLLATDIEAHRIDESDSRR